MKKFLSVVLVIMFMLSVLPTGIFRITASAEINGHYFEDEFGKTYDKSDLSLVTDTDTILKDAFELGRNKTTPYIAQLTGKVISIDKEYNAQYSSITVTMTVKGKNIQCYNMKGVGVDKIKIGDKITVKGVIKNFYKELNLIDVVMFTYDYVSEIEPIMVELIAGNEEIIELFKVDSPKKNMPYKFGLYQNRENKIYYSVGFYQGLTLATSTSPYIASDVYLEETDCGYYLYTLSDGQKRYMNIEVKGNYIDAIYSDEASTIFSYDNSKQTLTAKLSTQSDEKVEYVFGSQGESFNIDAVKKEEAVYLCHFYDYCPHDAEWDFNLATCTTDTIKKRICATCDLTTTISIEGSATGHIYDNACDIDCNNCGDIRMVGDHVYDYDCDADCNVCDEVREATSHRYNIYQKNDEEHWMVCECGKREFEYNYGHGYTRVCDSKYHWLECECGVIEDKKLHFYTNADDPVCDDCFMCNTLEPTLAKEFDGKWYYYVNGYRNYITDLIKINGEWKYIEKGVWATDIDKLHKINGKWFLIKKGVWKATTGLVEYMGKTFYVQGGKWDSSVNELKKLNGKWYFIKSGKWDKTLDSLHKLNGKWFLVKKGMWTATTGLVEYKGKMFYVKGGKWESRTGVFKIGSKYHYISGGKWDKTKTGVYKVDGKNYYIKKGIWDKKVTTLYKKDGKYRAIKDGMWYKGKAIIKYSGKKYYVNDGYAQTKYSGKVTINGKKYTVKKGIIE